MRSTWWGDNLMSYLFPILVAMYAEMQIACRKSWNILCTNKLRNTLYSCDSFQVLYFRHRATLLNPCIFKNIPLFIPLHFEHTCCSADKRLCCVDEVNNLEFIPGTHDHFNTVLSHLHCIVIAYSFVTPKSKDQQWCGSGHTGQNGRCHHGYCTCWCEVDLDDRWL